MNGLKSLFQHILHSWRHSPIVQLSAFFVLIGSYTIILSMGLFFSNMEKILVGWGSSIEMNVYISDSADSEKRDEIKSKLQSLGFFENIKYIDNKEASSSFLKKMSSYVPDFTDQEDFLDVVPASFLGSVKGDISLSQLETLSKRISKISYVEDVSYGQEWIKSFSSVLNTTKRTAIAISGILILGAFFVVSFTVYAVIVRRRDEIEIMKLLGATPHMIQLPFLFEAGVISAAAGVISIILSYGIMMLQARLFSSDMSYIGFTQYLHFFNISTVVLIVVGSFLVGSIFSLVCLRKVDKSMNYQEENS